MAKRRVRFYVTANDLLEGQPVNTHSCPIARAVSRRVKDDYRVVIVRDLEIEGPRGGSYLVLLPAHVQDRMAAIDTRQEVRPFDFHLDLPERVLRS